MKKQKKSKPKAKPSVTAKSNAAALAGRGAGPARRQSGPANRGFEYKASRYDLTAAALRKSAGYAGYKDALAVAATYSTDDRQALALLFLPFLILAVAMGSSQSMRWHPAYDVEIASRPPITQTAIPVQPSHLTEAREVRPSAPVLIAQSPPEVLASTEVAPPLLSPVVPSVNSSLEAAKVAEPLVAPAPAPASVAPSATGPDVAAVAAAQSILSPAGPAPELVDASKPIELAALPQPLEPSVPGPAITIAPLAQPSNVCVPETVQANKINPVRLAALGGETGGGYVDPIAFGMELAASAREQLDDFTVYTDQYRTIAYPNGDVPSFYGVCTDVIIRAYRGLGIDLQALVHQSKLGSGDTNIDHRRVGTLQKYFATYGESLPITEFAEDYWPGDVISYYRPQNAHSRSHIAVVSDIIGPSGNFMIIHNRGWGPQQEDALFVDQMTGHYRYSAVKRPKAAPVKAVNSKSAVSKSVVSKATTGPAKKPAQAGPAGVRASLMPDQPAPSVALTR